MERGGHLYVHFHRKLLLIVFFLTFSIMNNVEECGEQTYRVMFIIITLAKFLLNGLNQNDNSKDSI